MPVCRCGCRHLATSIESKAYFGFPWVRSWENRDKFYMDGKRIQCLSNASQHVAYPSIFNRFPVIQPESSKVRHFSTFLHILTSAGYAPGTIAVNVTWIEREFNACQTPRSIYPSIFNRLRAIARYWSEIATFSYPTCMGCSHWNSGKKFRPQKLESWGYQAVKIVLIDDRLSRFYTIPACVTDRRTDGRSDGRPAYR